tara:strand:- start:173 stop:529 length:357 start_codon:yes stop_codon:yes gene_type:complete
MIILRSTKDNISINNILQSNDYNGYAYVITIPTEIIKIGSTSRDSRGLHLNRIQRSFRKGGCCHNKIEINDSKIFIFPIKVAFQELVIENELKSKYFVKYKKLPRFDKDKKTQYLKKV